MLNPEFFTPAEQRIRNDWLFWTIKVRSIVLGAIGLAALFPLLTTFNLYDFMMLMGTAVLVSFLLYIPYHCAYKKPGTALESVSELSICC